jgi:hypothetical protein
MPNLCKRRSPTALQPCENAQHHGEIGEYPRSREINFIARPGRIILYLRPPIDQQAQVQHQCRAQYQTGCIGPTLSLPKPVTRRDADDTERPGVNGDIVISVRSPSVPI